MQQGVNVIHFIWAGGNELLSQAMLEKIKAWYVNNPDFQINLWIDKQTTPDAVKRYTQERNLQENYRFIYLKDITEEGIVSPEIRYELDRLQPNYQAASNLIRYSVLAKCGGCFFENDTLPHHPIAKNLPIYTDKHCFKTAIHYQHANSVSNEAMFSTQLDPTMLHTTIHAHNNYQNPLEEKWNDPFYYNQYDKRVPTLSCPKKIITDCRTGPNAVCTSLFLLGQVHVEKNDPINTYGKRIAYLKQNYSSLNNIINSETVFKHFHLSQSFYRVPQRSAPNWLNKSLKTCPTLHNALRVVAKTIIFEMKELGMIRDLNEMTSYVKRAVFQYYRQQQKDLIEKHFYTEIKKLPRLLPSTKDVYIENYVRALLNHFSSIKYDRDLINQDFGWLRHAINSEQINVIKSQVETNFLKKFLKPLIRQMDNELIHSHQVATNLKQCINELSEMGHVLKYDSLPYSWRDMRIVLEYFDLEQNTALDQSIQDELVRTIGALTNFRRNDVLEAYLSELMFFLCRRKFKENEAFIKDLELTIHDYRRQTNIVAEQTKIVLYMIEQYILLNRDEYISQGALAHLVRIIVAHIKEHDYAKKLYRMLKITLNKHEDIRASLYLQHPISFVTEEPQEPLNIQREITDKFKKMLRYHKRQMIQEMSDAAG